MRATTSCIPCYLKQALSAAMEVTSNPDTQRRVLNEVATLLPELSLESTPAQNSTRVLQRVHELLNCPDPFAAKKRHYNQLARGLYPRLKQLVEATDTPLETAVKIAAAGNVIDLGILGRKDLDIQATVDDVQARGLAVSDIPLLEERLSTPAPLLYLADNAGEVVFDRILIEELIDRGVDVAVAVKASPILNDATMEDAVASGLDELVRVVSNGSPSIGTDLQTCSDEFLREFRRASIIISKGQANFESLNETDAPLFFILKAKCPEVARELRVSEGEVVAMFNSRASLA